MQEAGFLSTLQRSLWAPSPESTRFLATRKGVETLDRINRPADLCLVGAELAFCETLDLTGIPANARQSYIKERVRVLSPFADYHTHIDWQDASAVVWFWSADIAIDPEVEQLPEHLFLERPATDGGVDRQVRSVFFLEWWQDGALVAARKFVAPPTERDKADFVARFASGEPVDWRPGSTTPIERSRHEPTPLSLAWLKQPAVLATIAITLAVVLLLFSGGRYVGWVVAVAAKERALAESVDRLEPLLALRAEALRLHEAANELEALAVRPAVLAIAADFETAVGALYGRLMRFSYAEGTLEVEVQGSADQTRAVIESLEASDRFSGVRALPGDRADATVIEARVAT